MVSASIQRNNFILGNSFLKFLIGFSILDCVFQISLGGFVRVTGSGLGCPDWPGCYGQSIPTSTEHITYDGQLHTVDAKKAWIEMIHRYSAACLGLCILMLLIVTIKQACVPLIKLSAALSVLIILQATLGMLTVTMKLQPIVVSLHLLEEDICQQTIASLGIVLMVSRYPDFTCSNLKNVVLHWIYCGWHVGHLMMLLTSSAR